MKYWNSIISLTKNISEKSSFWLLTSLTFLARALFITSSDIHHDEPFTIYVTQLPWDALWELAPKENNPIGHFVFIKLWSSVFGISSLSVRIPSLIFGVLSVGFLYKFLRQLFDQQTAVVASLALCFSTLHTFHSHEVRAYSLIFMLCTVSLYLLTKIDRSKSCFWLFIGAVTLNLYMHFSSLFISFLILVCGIILFQKDRGVLKKLIWSFAIISILFSPYLPILWIRLSDSAGGTWVTSPTGFNDIFILLKHFLNSPASAVAFVITLMSYAIIRVIKKRSLEKKEYMLLLWFLFPVIGMFFISLMLPMYLARYLIYTSVGISGFIGIFTSHLKDYIGHPKFKYVAYFPLLILIGSFNPDPGHKGSFEPEFKTYCAAPSDSTAIVLIPDYIGLHYLYPCAPELYEESKQFNDYKTLLEKRKIFCCSSLESFLKRSDNQPYKNIVYFDGWDELVDPELKLLNHLRQQSTSNAQESEHVTVFKNYTPKDSKP